MTTTYTSEELQLLADAGWVFNGDDYIYIPDDYDGCMASGHSQIRHIIDGLVIRRKPLMITQFTLELFKDLENTPKAAMLNRLELLFDDVRNELPPEYYHFSDSLQFGKKVRVTFEEIE